MSGALALAASIAAMDPPTLLALVRARRIVAPHAVSDPLGLALELLRPDSISRALQGLDRRSLAALDSAGDATRSAPDPATSARLRNIGLLGLEHDAPSALPEVAEALRIAIEGAGLDLHRGATQLASGPEIGGSQSADTSGWYAPALTAVRRAAALLLALREHPASLGRRGTVSANAIRELANAVHSDAEVVSLLVQVLRDAGLVTAVNAPANGARDVQFLVPVAAAAQWMSAPLAARWLELARHTWDMAGPAIRAAITASGGDVNRAVHGVLPLEYPLLPESLHAQALRFAETANELGLTVFGVLSAPGAALLAGDDAAARAAVELGFPTAVEGVYLQPDLSVIIPGPLPPADEQALSSIAEAEHWGVAVTLRITPASLRRAVSHGQSPASIRELLERVSLTGVPQPLEYLLGDVQRHIEEGRLLPGESGFGSPPSVEFTSGEADVRAANGALDSERALRDSAEGVLAGGEKADDDPLEALVARVLDAAGSTPGEADLGRRLELAIRDRSPVRVTASAAGQERTFVLLPVSLNAGRLRATDQGAGVQRTIPLSAIVAVEAA